MLFGIGMVLLFVATYSQEEKECPEVCMCIDWKGFHVKCENKELSRIPEIPQDATSLNFSFNNIEYIDENVFQYNFLISWIDLSHTNLTSIPENIFKEITFLEYVDLSHNQLVTLPEKLFCYNSLLNRIVIKNNMLTTFNFNMLINNTEIKDVALGNNKLQKLEISKTIVSLSTLRLRGNMLKSFPVSFFTLLPDLTTLEIADNYISHDIFYLEKGYFKMENLFMAENNVNEITSATLMNLWYIRQLFMNRNNISTISPNAFENCRKLYWLDLSDNYLHTIPDGLFNTLLNLEVLDLNSNCLTTLNGLVFTKLQNLILLDIGRNPFNYIAQDTFSALKNLNILNVSYIQDIKFKLVHFKYFKQLNWLIINNCNLTYKSYVLLDAISNINSLYGVELDGNPICQKQSERVLATEFFSHNPHIKVSCLKSVNNKIKERKCPIRTNIISYNDTKFLTPLCPSTCECGSQFYRNTFLSKLRRFQKTFESDVNGLLIEDLTNYTIVKCPEWLDTSLPTNVYTNIVGLIVHGNIKSVSENYFQNLSELEYLDLSRNKIDFLPLKLFHSLINLKTLNISYNYIKQFHPLQFQNLINLTYLSADHNILTNLNTVEFNLPKLEIVNLSHNQLKYINLSNLTKLKELYLNHNNISSVFINVSYSVVKKDTVFCNMSFINACQDFREMFLLKVLNLANNKISTVDRELFKDFSKLEELDISHNLIDTLPCGFLNSSKSLKKLRLGYNKVKIFTKCHILGLTTLSELSLNNNTIDEIDDEIFSFLRNLNLIDLSSNNLKTFPTGIIEYCDNILELYISNNPFIMKLENLKALTKPEKLAVENTSLELNPNYSFQHIGNFIEIYLSHNNIKNISEITFQNLTSLLYLNLSHNKINNIHNDSFQHLDNLETIDLSYNEIPELDESIFESNTNLLTLDLSYNRLYYIPPKLFFKTQNLKYLYLNSNNIQILDKYTFRYNKQIIHLDLSNNKMSVIDWDVFLILIFNNNARISVNLKNNSIEEIINVVGQFRYFNVSKIENLILSDNPQLKHKAAVYKEMDNVINLDLENTGITGNSLTALDTLFQVPKLQNINMNRNPICQRPGLGYLRLLFLSEFFRLHFHVSCSNG